MLLRSLTNMVQGESEDASLLVILAEPQPIFSKKKYTHDRAQIDLSELLEPPLGKKVG